MERCTSALNRAMDCVPGMVDATETDDFGAPLNIMGRHPEDFFSILGRIVALAAILENKILVFYRYLVGRRQEDHTELAVRTAHRKRSPGTPPVAARRGRPREGVAAGNEGDHREEERLRSQHVARAGSQAGLRSDPPFEATSR